MNRTEALALLNGTMDAVIRRAVNRRFRRGVRQPSTRPTGSTSRRTGWRRTVTTTDTDSAHAYCFQALLPAVVYDLAIPGIAATGVDVQVDAPDQRQVVAEVSPVRKPARCGLGARERVRVWLRKQRRRVQGQLRLQGPGHEGAREYG